MKWTIPGDIIWMARLGCARFKKRKELSYGCLRGKGT